MRYFRSWNSESCPPPPSRFSFYQGSTSLRPLLYRLYVMSVRVREVVIVTLTRNSQVHVNLHARSDHNPFTILSILVMSFFMKLANSHRSVCRWIETGCLRCRAPRLTEWTRVNYVEPAWNSWNLLCHPTLDSAATTRWARNIASRHYIQGRKAPSSNVRPILALLKAFFFCFLRRESKPFSQFGKPPPQRTAFRQHNHTKLELKVCQSSL